jgi:DNA-binding IclR family transcriptional regulator
MGYFVMVKAPRNTVNSSAAHVFEVLRFVADTPQPLGVTEISRRLGLPVSSVFRALTTLEDADYIHRFQNAPRFEVSMMPYLLNRALLSQFALYSEGRPTLYELARTSEDTVSLWMRLGWFAVRIGGAFGRSDTYHHARLGDVEILHEHPTSRTILAALSDGTRKRYAAFVKQYYSERVTNLRKGWQNPSGDASDVRRDDSDFDGFRLHSVVIRDQTHAPVGALACEGPAMADEQDRDARLRLARDRLEALIAAAPERHRSPFAHIDVDQIKLDLDKMHRPPD